MQTMVQKWGNSLAIRIPREYIKEVHLHQGSPVELKRDKNIITITPTKKPTNRQKLEILLQNTDRTKVHSETEWGKKEGNEIW